MHGAVEIHGNLLEVDSKRDKSLVDCALYKYLAYIAVMEVKLQQLNCEENPPSHLKVYWVSSS